jgi:hypothetical protein
LHIGLGKLADDLLHPRQALGFRFQLQLLLMGYFQRLLDMWRHFDGADHDARNLETERD